MEGDLGVLGMAKFEVLAKSEDARVQFIRYGTEVYWANFPWILDCVTGTPMGMRWECSLPHWKKYRHVYNWVIDV